MIIAQFQAKRAMNRGPVQARLVHAVLARTKRPLALKSQTFFIMS
jgi:hypothetical protein